MPNASQRWSSSGIFSTALISALSLLTMAGGTPLAAQMVY